MNLEMKILHFFLQRENLVNSLNIGATKNPFHTHTHTHKAFVDIISVSTLQNKMSCTVFITGI